VRCSPREEVEKLIKKVRFLYWYYFSFAFVKVFAYACWVYLIQLARGTTRKRITREEDERTRGFGYIHPAKSNTSGCISLSARFTPSSYR
jgi:hypothetical protein